ncbi:MAG: DegT/DnrJ/EryC1/StrS family aminotransferase [bacterium]|nr:DegT/DnrJ/EryC1/StrS family aminotransferase [bacterium]
MAVPLLDLRAQYSEIAAEVDEAIRQVVQNQRFVMGEEVSALEEEIAAYTGARHAIGCASGSDALLLALWARGVGPGDAVLCPTYTFFGTAGSIARLGARPVFVDIDPATYNICLDSARRVARDRSDLKAIVPVDLYGQAADLDGVRTLADELGLAVIEDAAQAIGSRDVKGQRVGSGCEQVCFSFFPSKNLGAYGDGGMITTQSDELAERARLLRLHGAEPKYHHALVGMNSRLDALQAAVLRVKLRHLESWHDRRQQNADHYDALFREAGALDSRFSLDQDSSLALRVPARPSDSARHIFNQYIVRVPADRRDALREHLASREIGSEIYYPIPLHLQACFKDLGGRPGDHPNAERAAKETVALPVFPELSKAQREAVAGAVIEFL